MAKDIKEGDIEYSCKPKKNCDELLKNARSEIAVLKKKLAEKRTVVITEEIEVETEVYRKHTLSLISSTESNDAKSTSSSNYATSSAETRYIPALTYQYQFDNGITPLIGVGVGSRVKPIIGLGYSF